jgi:ArsR family transcriptional regulator, zinc-responsive transcriptional repressor
MQRDARDVSDMELDQFTALFRLLSDKTRLKILVLLSAGERNVTSLCDELQLPQPTVSHHLGLLRSSNIIDNRRSGKQVFYALNGRVNLKDADMLNINLDRHVLRLENRQMTGA